MKSSEDFDMEKFESITNCLSNGNKLPSQFRDHELKGDYANCRECHIKSDLLLIYEVDNDLMVITLVDIGSHSELFG